MSVISTFGRTALAQTTAFVCALGAAMAAAPAGAVTFTEAGDAGQTQASALLTTAGAGALTDIFGSLLSATDADLYVINITSPGSFSATTVNATGGFLDTQLFLLTLAGAPVYVNDDDAGGLSVLSTLPAGGSFAPVAAGRYLLGVSMSGYDPVNLNNQLLFAMGAPTSVRGPATGLQPALLGAFFDSTFSPDPTSGSYDIRLTGAVAAVPEPASALLLLAGGALCVQTARRRIAAAAGRHAA